MKRSLVLTFAAAMFAAFAGCVAPAFAAEFTPEQKAEIGAIMKDYLINNPDVLRAAIEALDKHDKQVEAEARQSAVADQGGALFSSAHQANVGNPKGEATIVEFFDYNCHFCKGALPDMAKLLQTDPNMKLVLKDFPVLGPGIGRSGESRRPPFAINSRATSSGSSMSSFSTATARSARPRRSPSPKRWASTWTGSTRTWRAPM